MSSLRGSTALVARFLAGGAFNTAVGLALTLLLVWCGIAPVPANAGGFAAGLLFSFVVHRGFVFRGRGPVGGELLRYLFAFAVSYALNIGVLLVLARADVNGYLAQIVAVAAYIFLMFLLCWRFVFKNVS